MTALALRRTAVFAAVLGLALSAAVAAHAFTLQEAEGSANGGRGFKDLDIPKVPNNSSDSRFNNGDRTTIQQGNTTLQFGTRPSFDQQYNPSNMFNPYYRDGRW